MNQNRKNKQNGNVPPRPNEENSSRNICPNCEESKKENEVVGDKLEDYLILVQNEIKAVKAIVKGNMNPAQVKDLKNYSTCCAVSKSYASDLQLLKKRMRFILDKMSSILVNQRNNAEQEKGCPGINSCERLSKDEKICGSINKQALIPSKTMLTAFTKGKPTSKRNSASNIKGAFSKTEPELAKPLSTNSSYDPFISDQSTKECSNKSFLQMDTISIDTSKSISSATVPQNSRQDIYSEELLVAVKEKLLANQSNSLESNTNSLMLQKLPAVDIQAALVTQKLPNVEILSDESMSNASKRINVKYEKVAHVELFQTFPDKAQICGSSKSDEMPKKLPAIPEELEESPKCKEQTSIQKELDLDVESIPSLGTLQAIQAFLKRRCTEIRDRLEEEGKLKLGETLDLGTQISKSLELQKEIQQLSNILPEPPDKIEKKRNNVSFSPLQPTSVTPYKFTALSQFHKYSLLKTQKQVATFHSIENRRSFSNPVTNIEYVNQELSKTQTVSSPQLPDAEILEYIEVPQKTSGTLEPYPKTQLDVSASSTEPASSSKDDVCSPRTENLICESKSKSPNPSTAETLADSTASSIKTQLTNYSNDDTFCSDTTDTDYSIDSKNKQSSSIMKNEKESKSKIRCECIPGKNLLTKSGTEQETTSKSTINSTKLIHANKMEKKLVQPTLERNKGSSIPRADKQTAKITETKEKKENNIERTQRNPKLKQRVNSPVKSPVDSKPVPLKNSSVVNEKKKMFEGSSNMNPIIQRVQRSSKTAGDITKETEKKRKIIPQNTKDRLKTEETEKKRKIIPQKTERCPIDTDNHTKNARDSLKTADIIKESEKKTKIIPQKTDTTDDLNRTENIYECPQRNSKPEYCNVKKEISSETTKVNKKRTSVAKTKDDKDGKIIEYPQRNLKQKNVNEKGEISLETTKINKKSTSVAKTKDDKDGKIIENRVKSPENSIKRELDSTKENKTGKIKSQNTPNVSVVANLKNSREILDQAKKGSRLSSDSTNKNIKSPCSSDSTNKNIKSSCSSDSTNKNTKCSSPPEKCKTSDVEQYLCVRNYLNEQRVNCGGKRNMCETSQESNHSYLQNEPKTQLKRVLSNTNKYSTPIPSSSSCCTEATSLSEGEVRLDCNCSTSIGEIHLCHFARDIRKKSQHCNYKSNPEMALEHNSCSVDIQIERKFNHYDNWVSYYINKNVSSNSDVSTSDNLSSIKSNDTGPSCS